MNNTNCYSCNNCNNCDFCDFCDFCDSCYSCNLCYFCDSCYSCNLCYFCDFCNFCKGLRMSKRMLFCLGEGRIKSQGAGYQKNNQIFNTQVTKQEWDKALNSLPEIKLDIKDGYEKGWSKWWWEASKKDKDAILNLPHFNKDIFKSITGIDIEPVKRNPNEIQIDGATYVLKEDKEA